MKISTLKMISQIELMSVKDEHAAAKAFEQDVNVVDKNDNNNDDTHDGAIFSGIDDLQEFEQGVFALHTLAEEEEIEIHDHMGFIDTLFDFSNFTRNPRMIYVFEYSNRCIQRCFFLFLYLFHPQPNCLLLFLMNMGVYLLVSHL